VDQRKSRAFLGPGRKSRKSDLEFNGPPGPIDDRRDLDSKPPPKEVAVPRLDRAYAARLPAWPRLMEDEERVPDVPEEFRKKTKRRIVNVAPAVPVETKVHPVK